MTLLLMGAMMMTARTPIRQWFVEMPDSVMPLLTKNNRLDFIDFIDCNMEAVVTNLLDGKSCMKRLTDDYLHVEYTKVSDVEMKLLPVTDTTDVLCMVTTMKAAVNDSRVAFFGEGWVPLLVATHMKEPQLLDFRSSVQSDSAHWAWKKMDVFFRTYALSADEATLTCRLTTLEYLNRADREAVEPYVAFSEMVYSWKDGSFVRR